LPTRHVSFLQLGDVHFPDLVSSRPLADQKDAGFSSGMVDVVSSTRIAEITRGINLIKQDEPSLVAVVLTGDLTTRGDGPGYEACLKFLYSALKLSDHAYWKDRRIIVVPGNHDVNRSAIVNGQALQAKFEQLKDRWEKVFGTKDCLSVDAPIATDLPQLVTGSTGPSIRFLPLNTCYLCGEHRALPEVLREKFKEMLVDLKKTMPDDEFEQVMTEQIDCPAVSRDHVMELSRLIVRNEAQSISVVVGHHPLFAQPMPRIDGYNELLNAGFVRESVLETRRNVVYLHGHIHQDPLLLVNSPIRGTHRIIHISAPALQDGFNLVKIFFSTTTNQPLGLELTQYRFGDHLGLTRRPSIKIRLIDQDALWNEIDHPWTKVVLEKLSTPKIVLRFNDLLKAMPAKLVNGINEAMQVDALRKAILILELLELIEITNRESDAKHWQCRRKSI
jgi:3',5'-cyclic AMP phosphodiesterase CpdA